MNKQRVDLYTINKNVKCVVCGNKGAIQAYAEWCPNGLGDEVEDSESLAPYRDKPFMNHMMGFGGTIPHECMNCGNIGLIDIDELECYKKIFETIKENN